MDNFIIRSEVDANNLVDMINAKMGKYETMIIDRDNYGDAKKIKAEINKYKSIVDESRKEWKKEIMAPYTAVEPSFKMVQNKFNDIISSMDKQIKEIDLEDKNIKLDKLKVVYAKLECPIPFERVVDVKWLNKSVTEKKMLEELNFKVGAINSEINIIKSNFSEEVLNYYINVDNNLERAIEMTKKIVVPAAGDVVVVDKKLFIIEYDTGDELNQLVNVCNMLGLSYECK